MDAIFTGAGLISLFTLTIMEIVLGIDNVIFISILTNRIDPDKQKLVRRFGLLLALIVRIVLLSFISFLAHKSAPFFTIHLPALNIIQHGVSVRDIILIAGGLFLIYKSTTEIHASLEGEEVDEDGKVKKLSVGNAIMQIVLLDVVFSFDSILTAVGLVKEVEIMIVAVLVSMSFMLMSSKKISDFINSHPTIKMLALSFLMTIGVILVAESMHIEIPKGYVYYSLSFSLLVEFLNLRMRKSSKAVQLKKKMEE
ncbi:MAG: TerC family protein [Cytophagaceae bacterium]|jgi:predicted tellurium resistance membrane protein TerC|nr:TerC family protein [Cytophagaceae bacterium]